MMTTTFDPLGSTLEDEIYSKDKKPTNIDEILKELDELAELATEKDADEANENLTLANLYSPDYDMQSTISTIPDMVQQARYVIAEISRSVISPTWGDVETFESLCMDLIEKIVRRSKDWTRMDAIQEAAKELVAVRKAKQSPMAEKVHMRVLREFQIATNDEYLALRKQIWGE